MTADIRHAVGKPWGQGPLMIPCPVHGDTDASLAVYHDHGFCYGCRKYFTPKEILALASHDGVGLPEAGPGRAEKSPPPEPALLRAWQATLLDPRSPRYPRLTWLRNRGLTRATVEKARLGHDGRNFVIPIPDAEGRVTAVKRRRDDLYADPDAPRYLFQRGHPSTIYRPNPRGKVLAICEGELDALLLSQYGVDAITSTGGAQSLAKLLGGRHDWRRIHFLLDQDEAGEQATQDLIDAGIATFSDFRRIRWEGGKDVTDVLAPLNDASRVALLSRWFS